MERIIGRKKIEEIRNSLRMPMVSIESFVGSYDIPNFSFYITKKNTSYKILENYKLIEISKTKQLLDILFLFNEFCPCVNFELKENEESNHHSIIAKFGNEELEIVLDETLKVKKILNANKTNIHNLREYFKDTKVRNSIEYSILETALKKQYNIFK